mmetsp:Transcript_45167/g.118536  ORF Transcript_45167/g.118536 Transcript_45167/m.118536 type:complete len:549 (-) Transcript_45167:96-1742(-)
MRPNAEFASSPEGMPSSPTMFASMEELAEAARRRRASMEELAGQASRRRAAWDARQRAFDPDHTSPTSKHSPPAKPSPADVTDMLHRQPLTPSASPLRRVSSLCCSPSLASAPRTLKRSLSLPTKKVIHQVARVLTSKVRKTQHAQEQILYLLYKTRTSRRRVSWLTDPLAAWRIYWRWIGIVLLMLNASLLLNAGWHRHRLEADPLRVWPLRCDGTQDGTMSPADCSASSLHERLVAQSGSAVQAFSIAELALSLRMATVDDLSRSGYRRGYGGWLLTLDAWLVFDCAVDLEIWRFIWTDFAGRNLDIPAGAKKAVYRKGGRKHVGGKYRRFQLSSGLRDKGADNEGMEDHSEPKLPLVLGWAVDRGFEAQGKVDEVGHQIALWWGHVQRKAREHTWMRIILGYQRLSALPPPPWPLDVLLDDALLPAYFGSGLEAVKRRLGVLPAIGDLILETVLLHAFLASFFRSAKAVILLASAAKAVRVRRRLRRERAARILTEAWRKYAHRCSARRQLARLRWQQTTTNLTSIHSPVRKASGSWKVAQLEWR